MRIQSSGESNVIFKTKENVIMPETPEHAGFVVKRMLYFSPRLRWSFAKSSLLNAEKYGGSVITHQYRKNDARIQPLTVVAQGSTFHRKGVLS